MRADLKTRAIPRSGEQLPVVGLGTWQTFDVGGGTEERQAVHEVLSTFLGAGMKVIDSSPMKHEKLDFIQIPYSIADRLAEKRILPAAADTGTAVPIPATAKAAHVADNVQAALGRLPDAKQREQMAAAFVRT